MPGALLAWDQLLRADVPLTIGQVQRRLGLGDAAAARAVLRSLAGAGLARRLAGPAPRYIAAVPAAAAAAEARWR